MIPVLLIVVFWVAALGIFYTHLGYPLLIYLMSQLRPTPVQQASTAPARCAIVIAAYNEAKSLPAKLQSTLQGTNGEAVAEVWIGSDGSTDDTVSVVKALNDPRIQVIDFPERRGKPSVVNDLLRLCASDHVIFTDARQKLAEGAIPALLANFSDPTVGVVSGELIFRRENEESSVAEGMDFYWRYEKFIRRAESRFRSVPGATGALYAMRRDLFSPIPKDILLDDVAIPMQAVLQGFRCLLEDKAVVYDVPSRSAREESVRKRRTIAGNAQLLHHYPEFALPWRNPIWFEFMSHKLVRLLSPFLLALTLLTSLVLMSLHNLFFFAMVLAQLAFYVIAVLGLRDEATRSLWFRAPAMFVRLNLSTLEAWGDILSGRYAVNWTRAYTSPET